MDNKKWFEFDVPFNFVPDESPQSSVKYPPGVYRVRQQCIEKALAAGAGRVVDTPQGSSAHGQSAKGPELRSPQQKAVAVSEPSAGSPIGSSGEEREVIRDEGEAPSGGEPADR